MANPSRKNEDGDFYWRYHEKFNKEIPNIEIELIDNVHSDVARCVLSQGISLYRVTWCLPE